MIEAALTPPTLKPAFPKYCNEKQKVRAMRKVAEILLERHALRKASKNVASNESYYSSQLLTCCARVIALGSNCDLVFVGRSPESIFDHLSGLLWNTRFKERLTLLHFSHRANQDEEGWQEALQALREYFTSIRLDPDSLIHRDRPIAFVDLVSSGTTFYRLIELLKNWCHETAIDWSAVRKKIRIIGIVQRTKTSPNTARWQQCSEWKNVLAPGAIKNVSIDKYFWGYLGDYQKKSTISFHSRQWAQEQAYAPVRNEDTLIGIQNALYWFEAGSSRERRLQFAQLLSQQPEMKEAQLRNVVISLRSRSNDLPAKKTGGSRKPATKSKVQ